MSRLKAALDPKSVAIIGASENPNKVGGRPMHYLDKFGFKGRIFPINPSRQEVQGYKCYNSLADLPETPEMVIVAVAGDNAIGAVEDCAAHGVKIAVVMASGFGEVDAVAGKAKERRMVEVAQKTGMRIVGPNSQGLANFGTGAIASFSTMFMDMDRSEGHVAMLSQSGALSTVPVGFLRQRGIGVRHTHATGNDADISVGELAVAVAEDPEVKLLLLYLESIPEKKYLEELAAVALDRDLPIIALKSGRSEAGRQAAQSHRRARQRGPRGRCVFLASRHLACAGHARAGGGDRTVSEGLETEGEAAGRHQQFRRGLRPDGGCGDRGRHADGEAGAGDRQQAQGHPAEFCNHHQPDRPDRGAVVQRTAVRRHPACDCGRPRGRCVPDRHSRRRAGL
jgi:predicted CoA-binding protein